MANCRNCEKFWCKHKYGEILQGECDDYRPHYVDADMPIIGFEREGNKMLCSKCNHMHYDYCEDYMECDLFCDDFPEEYQRKDEEGCIFNERTIVSRIKAKQEEEAKFYQKMYEDMERELLEERGKNETHS